MQNIDGKGFSILIVDDEEGIQFGLKNLFEKEGFKTKLAGNIKDAVAHIKEVTLDVAVIDLRLKNNESGIELLKVLKRMEPDLVIIVITAYGSIDTAVASMKKGASDYILKPLDNRKLLDTVYKNLEIHCLKNENIFLRKELANKYLSYEFLTNSKEIKSLLAKADKIKNNPVTVLVTGESGTGKEVFSRYIHFSSNRRDEKFVSINCAALSENLLLSELFGHEKGSFTGAIERRLGKFEVANRGTLFLDEIGDMSLNIQAKVLRVIEESSFERLGGSKRINVNVRLIAATNRDLSSLIKEGKFREDLFYRINVVSFHLLPLRKRKEDVSLLISHFIEKYNKRYNKNVNGFSSKVLDSLLEYKWPGNVRELENIVNQSVLLCDNNSIRIGDLKKIIFIDTKDENVQIDISEVSSFKEKMSRIIEIYEKQIIKKSLIENHYNKTKTAGALSITRKTLKRKLNKYNL